ncbi:hypothetical protein OK016_28470 [Vibrio chagasii]|nr:hypothetical protein [Vibrio chagasii]
MNRLLNSRAIRRDKFCQVSYFVLGRYQQRALARRFRGFRYLERVGEITRRINTYFYLKLTDLELNKVHAIQRIMPIEYDAEMLKPAANLDASNVLVGDTIRK